MIFSSSYDYQAEAAILLCSEPCWESQKATKAAATNKVPYPTDCYNFLIQFSDSLPSNQIPSESSFLISSSNIEIQKTHKLSSLYFRIWLF